MLHGALKFKPETDTDVETPRIVRPVGAGLVAVGEIIIGPRLEIESEILHKIVTDTGSEPNRPQHTAGRQFIIDVGRKHPMIEDTGIPVRRKRHFGHTAALQIDVQPFVLVKRIAQIERNAQIMYLLFIPISIFSIQIAAGFQIGIYKPGFDTPTVVFSHSPRPKWGSGV